MKITIIWEQDSWGGVDSHIGYLLSSWPDKKDVFTIITNAENQGLARVLELFDIKNHISVIKIQSLFIKRPLRLNTLSKVFRHIMFPAYFLIMVTRYQSLLRKHPPDVVLAQNGSYPGSYGTLAGVLAASYEKVAVVSLLIHHAAIKPALFQMFSNRIIDHLVGKAITSLLTVSKATLDTIFINRAILQSERIHAQVIHNGVSFASYLIVGNASPIDFIGKYNIPRNKKIIGIVGRIEEYKGHEDLLTAVSYLGEESQEKIAIVFVGRGDQMYVDQLLEYSKYLKIRSEIFLTGYIGDNIFNVVSNFHLLCSLTRNFEGFGLTIAEAMAVGVPVLATNVGGVVEFVNNETATLIEPCDPGAITSILDNFLHEEHVYLKKAVLAKRHIIKFSSEIMSKRYYQHIKSKLFFSRTKNIA